MSDPPELAEDVDLAVEHRRYVLDVYTRLAGLDHYQLLGVRRDADKKQIRTAYFHLAGFIHPDRYFRKKLGSYKPKLEAIFARITVAYETLSAPQARAAYDATLPAESAAAPAPAPPPARVDLEVEKKRQAAAEALRQTFTAGVAKGAEHAQAAARARAAGDVVAAAAHYRRALAFAPTDAALRAALAEVEQIAAERSCAAYRRQAMTEKSHGHWARAAASWQRVVDATPSDAEAKARLANALARASGSVSG